MAKVGNVTETAGGKTPAAEPVPGAIKAANVTKQVIGGVEHVYVDAEDGKKYGLRKMKPSLRFHLDEAADVKTMSGAIKALVVGSVVSIDEEGYMPIFKRAEFLNRLDEIGDEGLMAITPVVLDMYGMALSEAEIEAAKN